MNLNPSDKTKANNGLNIPQQFGTQPLSHQNIDIGLTQPLSHPSELSTSCSSLSTVGHVGNPKFPPQNFDVPDISITNSLIASSNSILWSNASTGTNTYALHSSAPNHMMSQYRPLTTISHTDVSAQLGFQSSVKQGSPSSVSTSSPSRESSEDSDDSLPLAQVSF